VKEDLDWEQRKEKEHTERRKQRCACAVVMLCKVLVGVTFGEHSENSGPKHSGAKYSGTKHSGRVEADAHRPQPQLQEAL
jgi:hypothetical protein